MESNCDSGCLDFVLHMILILIHSLVTLLSRIHLQYVSWSRRIRSILGDSSSSSRLSSDRGGLTVSSIQDSCQILTQRPSHVAFVVQDQGKISFKVCPPGNP